MILKKYLLFVIVGLILACRCNAGAVAIDEPWTRATVAGQTSAGVFMKLTADTPMWLIGVSTPDATWGEVHEMRMDEGVARMRPLKTGLELPVGHEVVLSPRGYHLMLTNLKKPLVTDSVIPMSLVLVDAQGVETVQSVIVPVRALSAMHGMDHHEHAH